MVAKLWCQKKPKAIKVKKASKAPARRTNPKLPGIKMLVGKNVETVNLATLASLIFGSRNRFCRVIWMTDISARLYKRHEIEVPDLFGGEMQTKVKSPFLKKSVARLYCCVMRNDFDFKKSVLAELKRRGHTNAGKGWTPQQRSWGQRLHNRLPFVIYQAKTPNPNEPIRLYGNFLPAIDPRTGKHAYHHIENETGFYVNGAKVDDDFVKAFLPERNKPTEPLTAARLLSHPINMRLDDVLWFKVSGKWYKLAPSTREEIESLAGVAVGFADQLNEAG